MFKQTATNLLKQRKAHDVTKWLKSFDTVIADCDGVLWSISKALEGSADVINRFQEIGKTVYLFTNNSIITPLQIKEKANKLGFKIELSRIITTASGTAQYLSQRNFQRKAYVIGMQAMVQQLQNVGIEILPIGADVLPNGSIEQFLSEPLSLADNVGAVIVAFDPHISYPKICKALNYLKADNCLFLATNTSECVMNDLFALPGTGAIVRAVQTCVGRDPVVIGKPNTICVDRLIREGTIKPNCTLMIGDRCDTDILFGYNCGFQTMLVGSGVHKLRDVKMWRKSSVEQHKKLIPDVYLPKLGDLLQFMNEC